MFSPMNKWDSTLEIIVPTLFVVIAKRIVWYMS